jgi:hypothetical protein
MKDGTYKTNPGVNNPDIVKSAGAMDERVNIIRFNRECGDNIVLVNFGNHPDTVGGNNITADWPGFTRRIFEKAIDDTKCIVFNGAQGDINHVNVWPKGGDFNDMFNDFDDVSRGYGHSRHMGNVMAASAMKVYDKVEYIDVDKINVIIQRESIIHSGIELIDGGMLVQMGVPDMKLPIQYALTYPYRAYLSDRLDLVKLSKLTFFAPDTETFKCLPICINAIIEGGLKPTAANGANEMAVELFLKGKIGFLDIADLVEKATLAQQKVDEFNLEDVFSADKAAREFVLSHV